MLAKLASYALVGIDAMPVEVEVDVSFSSAPKTILVGLAETAVKESTHRVERAIVNSGFRRPIDRVVINLRLPISRKTPAALTCRLRWGCSWAAARLHSTGQARLPSSASSS